MEYFLGAISMKIDSPVFPVHFFLGCIYDKGERMTIRERVEGKGEEKRLAETLHLPSVTWQTSLASIYKFLGYQIWKPNSFSPPSSDSDLNSNLLRITSGIQFLTLGF